MRFRVRNILSIFLLGCMYFVHAAHASVISPSSGQNSEIEFFTLNGNAIDDFLKIRPANQSGISVNKFDTFNVTSDRPLKILNTKGLSAGERAPTAEIIVIEADDIQLSGSIEIVGPLADIIFISTTSGAISCNSCELKNIFRVVLASAHKLDASNNPQTLNSLTTNIGSLKAASGGSVTINGMNAIGALAVEVVSDSLNLSGIVETNQLAVEKLGGGYEPSNAGDKKIGSASFSAALGDVIWDFDTQNLLSSNPSVGSSSMEGQVYAVSAKIWASYPLLLNTEIDTRTDALSSIRYRSWDPALQRYVDKNHIAKEGISLQIFSEESEYTAVGSRLFSNNSVLIRSTGGLNFASKYVSVQTDNIEYKESYRCGVFGWDRCWRTVNKTVTYNVTDFSLIDAPYITVVATDELFIGPYIKMISDDLKLGGQSVYNRGRLAASMKLEGYGKKNLINEFGGRLQASTLHLQADNGFVRNGSRTPFVPNESDVGELLDYRSSDLIMLDAYKIGTFYKTGMEFDLSEEKFQGTMQSQLLGDNILIRAKAFENINPYWEQISTSQDPNEFQFQENRVNQVGVYATNAIQIKSEKYILNSSAGIMSEGSIQFDSPTIINERYRVLSILQETLVANQDSLDGYEYNTAVVAYSPPGLINALGNFSARAYNGFSNKASYFDIGGNGEFLANKINFYGVESGNGFVEGYFTTYHDESYSCGAFGWDRCWNRDIPTNHLDITKSNPTELDSLFHIGGNASGQRFSYGSNGSVILGTGVDLDIKNIESFDAFVEDLVGDLFSEDFYNGFNTSSDVDEESNTLTTVQYIKTDYHCNPYLPDLMVPIDVAGVTIFIPVRDCQLKDTQIKQTYNFLEELKKFYDRILAVMTSWLEDLDWWN